MSGIPGQPPPPPPTAPQITQARCCAFDKNVILEIMFFLSQAGQTENKQTSLDERSPLAKAERNAKPHACRSGSSFFVLGEPTQRKKKQHTAERERLSFMMLRKTKKMTRQRRRRASQIHMKSCICVHAYLLISAALNSSLLSSAPNPASRQ